jgi:predicted metal-dependent peptidase
VQHHDEFEQGEEVNINFHSGGGTDMRAGFDFVEKMGIEAACMVTLTDGYTPFPESTDIPAIWCISSDEIKSPTGETIPFTMHE